VLWLGWARGRALRSLKCLMLILADYFTHFILKFSLNFVTLLSFSGLGTRLKNSIEIINNKIVITYVLKRVFAKNERGYRLIPNLIYVVSKRRKWLKNLKLIN